IYVAVATAVGCLWFLTNLFLNFCAA
ncbi:hypothetical protein A2U01_0115488, partial [Trifolium medium]|nr:hypothetical protein [Trifolium medium]